MIWIAYLIIALVVLQRFGELILANRNTQRLKARGGIEIGAPHYRFIVLLHMAWLMAVLWLLPMPVVIYWPWIVVFVALQAARVWVIASLGPYWTTRIISLPGVPLVKRGPYRFVRHPMFGLITLGFGGSAATDLQTSPSAGSGSKTASSRTDSTGTGARPRARWWSIALRCAIVTSQPRRLRASPRLG